MVKVGDIIKSFDFPSTDSCYMIGKVIEILNDSLIRCETVKVVFDGKTRSIIYGENDFFTTPKLGLGVFDSLEKIRPRIEILK